MNSALHRSPNSHAYTGDDLPWAMAMESLTHRTTHITARRTKIVATIGPASSSKAILKQMIEAGMDVARLNFSHGGYDDHARTIGLLREVSQEHDTPITLLQDLQGPKIRVSQLPNDPLELAPGTTLDLVPLDQVDVIPGSIGIDYPYLAEEAQPGMQILLDDGLLELTVEAVVDDKVTCRVIQRGDGWRTRQHPQGHQLPQNSYRAGVDRAAEVTTMILRRCLEHRYNMAKNPVSSSLR